jgi:hypothetical protein
MSIVYVRIVLISSARDNYSKKNRTAFLYNDIFILSFVFVLINNFVWLNVTSTLVFWIRRIRKLLGHPDPLVRVRIRIRIRILLSSSKNSNKNLDCECFVTSL